MKEFQFYQAATVAEALELLGAMKSGARVIAGGTDILLELNEGRLHTENIININKLNELKYIRREDGVVRIGALSTFDDLDRNDYLRERVKVIHTAAANMGSPQIRNLATVGGNLVNASVAGDSLGAFIALDASVVLKSVGGTRTMKLTEFYAGQNKTEIAHDELMTEIFFDDPNDNTATSFVKLAKREALAIVVIDVCAVIERTGSGVCKRAQLAIGAVGRYPFRLAQIEEYLIGKQLTRETCLSALPMFSQAVYDSISYRPSVTYKKESVKGIAGKMFENILTDLSLV